MFVSYVQKKKKEDSQYQLDEIQDQAIYLDYFLSILLEFDTNYTPKEGQLSGTFYNGLRLWIKL